MATSNQFYPIFLSVVLVARNQAQEMPQALAAVGTLLSKLVSDYELIVIDNASDDSSLEVYRSLTAPGALPNLQIYALTKRVDADTASWVGVENGLGDFTAVIDLSVDDVGFLPQMLEHAVRGSDVVFARNQQDRRRGFLYRPAFALFNLLYKRFNGINLAEDAPQYRVISRRVVNFLLQHPQPAATYRTLPATAGFARTNFQYSAPVGTPRVRRLGESIDSGVRQLVSSTRAPMRLVTALSTFGAVANVAYSIYVLGVALLKEDVAPGWVSLSLQQSGMFFLISLVLLVLGEYILHMAGLANEGPRYHVAQEFTSSRMTRHEKLNLDEPKSELSGRASTG